MRVICSCGIKRLPSITQKANAKARVTVQALVNLSGAFHMSLHDECESNLTVSVTSFSCAFCSPDFLQEISCVLY